MARSVTLSICPLTGVAPACRPRGRSNLRRRLGPVHHPANVRRERALPVHEAMVVLEHQIANQSPLMPSPSTEALGVRSQRIEKRFGLLQRQPIDVRVLPPVDVERLPARLRVRAHDGMSCPATRRHPASRSTPPRRAAVRLLDRPRPACTGCCASTGRAGGNGLRPDYIADGRQEIVSCAT